MDEDVDTNVVFDLRNALFPPAGVGFDLYSANIQRGRERGLADYNQVRADFGLERVKSFDELTSDKQLADTLEDLYGTVEDVDLLVGMFAEDSVASSGAGETIQAIVGEQFERLRDADRFWFERSFSQGGYFTKKEIKEIQETTYADIIKLNTEITELQENVFLEVSEANPLNAENLFSDGLLDLQGDDDKALIEIKQKSFSDNTVGFYEVNCNKNIRYTCSPFLSPIDKLRLDLGDMWLAGACIENLHNRTMLAGIGRVFEDNFELPPHQDILARDILDAPIYPTYPFSNLETQLSSNIYLRTPKFGGELEIWNVKPSTITQPEIHDKEYKYEGIIDRSILPPATAVIKPQIGELILFDSARVHAVRASHGGPRVSMSMFIGYRNPDEPLTYWS